ncbi:MAG TPA: endolytic transglycosylase MltG, partial [Kiritimatiellia bacterium]|nr:endolytic transglycosylase MltG [Kiritimatiellia bacterium]
MIGGNGIGTAPPPVSAAAPVADPFDFAASPAADPFDFAAAPAAASAVPANTDDPFAGLFGTAGPVGAAGGTVAFATDEPARGGGGGGGSRGGSGRGGSRGGEGGGGSAPRPKRSLKWLAITLPIVIVLGLGAGGAAYAWFNYEDQVRELFGWELPNDYESAGNGEEVVVTIQSGDLGSDVANTLHDAGVTMTFDAFYDLLLSQSENVNFIPGNYTLQKEMSAQSALDALLDPANKVTSKLLITEGTVLTSTLEIISETTGIPLEDVQAAAADPTVYGLAASEPSLEGWLFPATYDLDGSETAQQILQMLVDEMISRLDGFGVAPES